MTDDLPDLGSCCNCGRRKASNIVMLDRRGPKPGQGWGCVVCGLPPDGAVAVLCNACVAIYPPRFVCDGYIKKRGRALFESLPPGEFKHDDAKHADELGRMHQ